MRKYAFASTMFVVSVVAGLVAICMLFRAWDVEPAKGVSPDRYTAKEKGPSLDDAIGQLGDTPENAYEPE